ncbi:MAG: hypothetical protein EBT86_11670 [Actinobacteria bacterium]|nr:hypothetical protein [Actinomycetota bacterium]
MRIVVETTVWKGATPNHVYVLDDAMQNMIAYVPQGSDKVKKFRAPIAFDRRGRTFVDLEDTKPDPDVITRTGSKGEVYYISQDKSQGWRGWSCTCPGFTFRGSCKHVAEIQQDLYGRDPY